MNCAPESADTLTRRERLYLIGFSAKGATNIGNQSHKIDPDLRRKIERERLILGDLPDYRFRSSNRAVSTGG